MAKELFVESKSLDRLTIQLKQFPKEMKSAAYSAINRTLDHVVTQVGRIVPKTYAIKATDVKDSFKGGIKRPSQTNLEASVTSKGHTLSIAHFPHSPETLVIAKSLGVKHKKAQIKVKVKKGSYKYIKTIPGAFLASTGAKSADKVQFNVFKRVGKARLPIKVIRTLSVPQMITNENIGKEIQNIASSKLAERIEHEIDFRLKKMGDKIK